MGLIEFVSRLIEFGADVNTQGGYYGNPIQATSVELLLYTGWANPDTHNKNHGRTPFYRLELKGVMILIQSPGNLGVKAARLYLMQQREGVRRK